VNNLPSFYNWAICIISPPERSAYPSSQEIPVMGETHETLVLWRLRAPVHGVPREVQCTMDHLGENFYELHLRCGREELLNEPFEETGTLLTRARELWTETKAGTV
jgi:hypothetical protein